MKTYRYQKLRPHVARSARCEAAKYIDGNLVGCMNPAAWLAYWTIGANETQTPGYLCESCKKSHEEKYTEQVS
jgi:hypothetical protein